MNTWSFNAVRPPCAGVTKIVAKAARNFEPEFSKLSRVVGDKCISKITAGEPTSSVTNTRPRDGVEEYDGVSLLVIVAVSLFVAVVVRRAVKVAISVDIDLIDERGDNDSTADELIVGNEISLTILVDDRVNEDEKDIDRVELGVAFTDSEAQEAVVVNDDATLKLGEELDDIDDDTRLLFEICEVRVEEGDIFALWLIRELPVELALTAGVRDNVCERVCVRVEASDTNGTLDTLDKKDKT